MISSSINLKLTMLLNTYTRTYRKLKYSIIFIICILIAICLAFSRFDMEIFNRNQPEVSDTILGDNSTSIPVPFCFNGILNKNEFYYDLDAKVRRNDWTMMRPKKRCLLHQYNRQDVTRCLDSSLISLPLEDDRKLSFAFIGDSRIRHQFYSFMEMIPEAEALHKQVRLITKTYTEDIRISVLSGIIRLSFYWRPSIVSFEFIRMIRTWIDAMQYDPAHRSTPNFIMMGGALHDLVNENVDYESYVKALRKLKPSLDRLSKFARIVWLNQVPTLEFDRNPNISFTMHSSNLFHYNQVAEKILRGSGVEIWDSGDPIAEEYIRSCSINRRQVSGNWSAKNILNPYLFCLDHAHLGYAATRQNTQLLLNELCNRALSSDDEF